MVLFMELNELTCHGPAFERRFCIRTHRLSVVERAPYGRPQITARADRVRRKLTGLRLTLALRATAFAFERTSGTSSLHFMSILLLRSRFDGKTCLKQNNKNK
jgi:hypothetical protein